MKILTQVVPLEYKDKERLSKYLVGKMLYLETLSAVKKAIKVGRVTVNGKIATTGYWVQIGDVIKYSIPISADHTDTKIEVLFEDDHLLIVNKPPGLLSSGVSGPSLQTQLMDYRSSGVEDALSCPYLIHRLDKATSGIMMAARSMEARRSLGTMLETRAINKEYSVIVEGIVSQKLEWITTEIDGQSAKTEILSAKPLVTRDASTYVRVRLHTGRTHQIRRHLADAGHPIIGDILYNSDGLSFGYGLFLMADRVQFIHPITSVEVDKAAPLHKKFDRYISR